MTRSLFIRSLLVVFALTSSASTLSAQSNRYVIDEEQQANSNRSVVGDIHYRRNTPAIPTILVDGTRTPYDNRQSLTAEAVPTGQAATQQWRSPQLIQSAAPVSRAATIEASPAVYAAPAPSPRHKMLAGRRGCGGCAATVHDDMTTCDEWAGLCRIKNLKYDDRCGGLKAGEWNCISNDCGGCGCGSCGPEPSKSCLGGLRSFSRIGLFGSIGNCQDTGCQSGCGGLATRSLFNRGSNCDSCDTKAQFSQQTRSVCGCATNHSVSATCIGCGEKMESANSATVKPLFPWFAKTTIQKTPQAQTSAGGHSNSQFRPAFSTSFRSSSMTNSQVEPGRISR